MAKLPPKKGGGDVGDWLNTYADMVTLLLTFFVLLFACSNLDETKLQYVFQEFKSRGKYINNVVKDQDPTAQENGGNVTDNPTNVGGEGSMPQSFEELYQYLADYVDENNLSESVAVEQGEAHLKIRFDSAVMFDGNSSYLKQEGRDILDGMIPGIKAVKKCFSRCTVSGHTAMTAVPSAINDWNLSSLRAVSVVNYLDAFETLEESKYRVMGCGPYEPIDENDPAKNRRVEMLLLKNELDFTDPAVIQDILEHDYSLGTGVFDPDAQNKPENNVPGEVDKIIGFITDKFNGDTVTNTGKFGLTEVDGSKYIQTEESGGDADKAGDNTSS